MLPGMTAGMMKEGILKFWLWKHIFFCTCFQEYLFSLFHNEKKKTIKSKDSFTFTAFTLGITSLACSHIQALNVEIKVCSYVLALLNLFKALIISTSLICLVYPLGLLPEMPHSNKQFSVAH